VPKVTTAEEGLGVCSGGRLLLRAEGDLCIDEGGGDSPIKKKNSAWLGLKGNK